MDYHHDQYSAGHSTKLAFYCVKYRFLLVFQKISTFLFTYCDLVDRQHHHSELSLTNRPIVESEEDLQDLVDSVRAESAKMGLQMNVRRRRPCW